jgi:hypothetical protein
MHVLLRRVVPASIRSSSPTPLTATFALMPAAVMPLGVGSPRLKWVVSMPWTDTCAAISYETCGGDRKVRPAAFVVHLPFLLGWLVGGMPSS